jgi:hypothetical protein
MLNTFLKQTFLFSVLTIVVSTSHIKFKTFLLQVNYVINF